VFNGGAEIRTAARPVRRLGSLALELLDPGSVVLGDGAGHKRPEVATLEGLRVEYPGIDELFAGQEISVHDISLTLIVKR
jgi:hypothetical protein